MIPTNLVYCELDLDYPADIFCSEVDSYLIDSGMLIKSVQQEQAGRETNQQWNMMPDWDYIQPDSHMSWYANSLLYCDTDDQEFKNLSLVGSIIVRNNYLGNADWKWKPEYEHLELTKFIKNLPLTDIIHARTLSMPPGRMSCIHRDSRRSNLSKTLLSDAGYISVTLNLSDGGQPLYFSLDSEPAVPITTRARSFVFNDYNLHGVPRVTEWRRQVRITGKPTNDFLRLLKMETIVIDN